LVYCAEIILMSNKVALVGNPNVGKSIIFGLLTGQYVTVSNYPGTTVEVTEGTALSIKDETTIIDTPGINSLIPNSEDERVTRDILLDEKIDYVVQVADAKNLLRALFLSIQISEIGISYCLVLNMNDEAQSRGIKTDIDQLSRILNAPVIVTIAVQKEGIGNLIKAIRHGLDPSADKTKSVGLIYDSKIEEALKQIGGLLPSANESAGNPVRAATDKSGLELTSLVSPAAHGSNGVNVRFQALICLLEDRSCAPVEPGQLAGLECSQSGLASFQSCDASKVGAIRKSVQNAFGQPLSYIINQVRLSRAEEIVRQVQTAASQPKDSLSGFPPERMTSFIRAGLGRITMHPVWGILILLAVLFLLYEFVGVFGAGTIVNFLENVVFKTYINPFVANVLAKIIPVGWIVDFFTGQYGMISMALSYGLAIILPIVGTFFLAFGIMEDSGYLPRLAVMVNRAFRVIGLNGKAVLPLVLGLGCDTMATMATRILPSRKERILTTLILSLGVPCSAQLGVIMGLMSGLSLKAFLWWFGCLFVIMFTVSYFANKVIRGTCSDFMMEIPPMRMPEITNILTKTFARVKWYLKEVIPIFILGTAVLFAMDKAGLLGWLEKAFSPVITGMMNLPAKATEAFLIGFFRRDYGAAGLYDLAQQGLLSPQQIVVALITITLFVPCFAQFLMMVKELGWKVGLIMVVFIFPLAILVGSLVNLLLNLFGGL